VANTASKKDNLNYALMHRLAAGAKIKVDKQEMKRLTKKKQEKQVKRQEELAELRKQMMKKRKTAASVQGDANHN